MAPVSEDTLSRAEELMMNRDFDAAREVYAQLTEERPTDMMGWHGLGTTYLIEGNLEEAVPALEKAWQKAGGECDSQRMLFLAEFARGSIGRCAEILEEIKDEQFHVAYGPLCSVVRDQTSILHRPIRQFLQVIRTISRGSALSSALQLFAFSPNRWTLRVIAEALWATRLQHRPDEVFEAILRERLTFLGARHWRNQDKLAYGYLSLPDSRMAKSVALTAESSYPDRSVFPLLAGHAAFMAGDPTEASEHYERASLKAPKDWVPALHLAASLVYEGKPAAAAEILADRSLRFPSGALGDLFRRLPEPLLAEIPNSLGVTVREESSPVLLQESRMPTFEPESGFLGGARLFRANLAGIRHWLDGKRKHAPLLGDRKEIPCPACDSRAIQFFTKNRATGMSLGKCADCGHVFAEPMPSAASLASLYDSSYFKLSDRYAKEVMELHSEGADLPSWDIYDEWLDWIESVDRKDATKRPEGERKAFDVGCASGPILVGLRNRGWQVLGQDIGGGYEEYYSTLGIPYSSLPVTEMEMDPESLDLCTMTHVIEHLPDPYETVTKIAEWLNPGGRICIMTPCCGTITAWLGGRYWFYMTEHVQFFTPHSLVALLRRCGLEEKYWRTKVGVRWFTPYRSWREQRIRGSLQRFLEQLSQGDVIELVAEKPGRQSGT